MAGNVREVVVPTSTRATLPEAGFADAFQVEVAGAAITAREAAERAFAKPLAWLDRLMAVRNAVVRPFGLRTGPEGMHGPIIGFFPVVSETDDRIVLGFDDRHLDFRIVVDVAPNGADGAQVIATTLVKTHNLLGRTYLAIITPFHKAIVPVMLRRIANP